MKVIITGAGIGGLATALALHDAGMECEVHEQGEEIRELGVGINVLPHGVGELARLGLLDRLTGVAVRTAELRYAHRLGHEILRRPCGLADARNEWPQLSIHRGRLQGVLLEAVRERLGPDAVRTGHRVVELSQDADTVTAAFADRSGRVVDRSSGDVLVGADGIHSTVRGVLHPDQGPLRWNGVLMWRGATDWPVFLDGATVVIAGGNAAKLVLYPIAPGSAPDRRLTNWAVCVAVGADGDPAPQRADWARRASVDDLAPHLERFRTPHVDLPALVAATGDVYEYPMCDRDPLPSWSHGRITLLGDAAHPMFPMGSNGAGQAILDVAALRRHLVAHADPVTALAEYEDERRPATADIVLSNRIGGPERVIDEVEARAPDGFDDLADVIDPAELDAIVNRYSAAAVGRR
jgi:2-polyprenyl-6-methoxyphenol hydroxylase-like FAD-dependent oxidoreductase